jgi:NADH dehydrogenase
MILVAGGTGNLGTALVRRLIDRHIPVRILTREPARAGHLAGRLVEVVQGDVRNPRSLAPAVAGVDTVVSAIHGFSGGTDGSPASIDRDGNRHLVDAASDVGAGFVLVSIVGAAADSRIDLFRAKHDAERYLQQSQLRWTIVRATAFIETWAMVMGAPLMTRGKTMVFGRGDNPINFVSAADVAALVDLAVVDSNLRSQVIELGGTENMSFNQLAALMQEAVGGSGSVRHIPRAILRAMAILTRPFNPGLARHARAAIVMDTRDMTFDARPTRRAFPDLPDTDLAGALKQWFAKQHRDER